MKLLISLLLCSLLLAPGLAADADDINTVQSTHEKIVAADPKNLNSLFILGLVYEKKRQTQDALRVWRQYLAAETDPQKQAIAQKHIHQLSQ